MSILTCILIWQILTSDMLHFPNNDLKSFLFPFHQGEFKDRFLKIVSIDGWDNRNQVLLWAVAWQNQQDDSAHSEDSDQTGHLPSLISLCCLKSLGPKLPIKQMPRLIWVFAGCTGHFVRFVVLWFIYTLHFLIKNQIQYLKKNSVSMV